MTRFADKIEMGVDPGVPTRNTVGIVVVAQEVTITGPSSGGTGIVLPAYAEVKDFTVLVRGSASANTAGLNVRVGNGVDEDYFATIKVSGVGLFRPGVAPNTPNAVSANAMLDIGASSMRVFADVTAVSSVAGQTDNFEAILTVYYVPRV